MGNDQTPWFVEDCVFAIDVSSVVAAAAAVVEQQKAAMQSMFRLPLGQSSGRPSAAASALMSPTGTGYNTSTPPNNRLQLKVKTTSPTAPAPQGNFPLLIKVWF